MEKSDDEYHYWKVAEQITDSHNYYMHPYTINFFGSNVSDVTKPMLLTRVWLRRIKDVNHTLVLMERCGTDAIVEYSYDQIDWTKTESSETLMLTTNDKFRTIEVKLS